MTNEYVMRERCVGCLFVVGLAIVFKGNISSRPTNERQAPRVKMFIFELVEKVEKSR